MNVPSESDALHETFELSVDVWNQNSKKIFDAEYPLGTCRRLPASCGRGLRRTRFDPRGARKTKETG